jgi:hypothetical protein
VERKDCFSCAWLPIGPNPIAAATYDDTVNASTAPVAYLYHVIQVGSGSGDSPPSLPDYAVTATVLFAENIVTGKTPVRGSHVQELRKAIDALRSLASLPAYMTPTYTDGWPDYNAPTGPVLASHQTAMRTALDQAVFNLTQQHPAYTGTTLGAGVGIFAYHMTQLRSAVK